MALVRTLTKGLRKTPREGFPTDGPTYFSGTLPSTVALLNGWTGRANWTMLHNFTDAAGSPVTCDAASGSAGTYQFTKLGANPGPTDVNLNQVGYADQGAIEIAAADQLFYKAASALWSITTGTPTAWIMTVRFAGTPGVDQAFCGAQDGTGYGWYVQASPTGLKLGFHSTVSSVVASSTGLYDGEWHDIMVVCDVPSTTAGLSRCKVFTEWGTQEITGETHNAANLLATIGALYAGGAWDTTVKYALVARGQDSEMYRDGATILAAYTDARINNTSPAAKSAATAMPASAAAMATAMGGGTWSHGWGFEDNSGTAIAADFGGTALTLSSATGMTYAKTSSLSFDEGIEQTSGTSTCSAAGVWSSSTLGFFARFKCNATVGRNLISTGGDLSVTITSSGKLAVGVDAVPSLTYDSPSYFLAKSGTFKTSTFVYNDDLIHTIWVWHDASTDTIHVLTEMEYFTMAVRSDFATTTQTLSLFYVSGTMSGVGVTMYHLALLTGITGLSATTRDTWNDYLLGTPLPSARTAWPDDRELRVLTGLGSAGMNLWNNLSDSSLPIPAVTGTASFDTSYGSPVLASGELFSGFGAVYLPENAAISTPASGAGSMAASTTPWVVVVANHYETNTAGAYAELAHRSVGGKGFAVTLNDVGNAIFGYEGATTSLAQATTTGAAYTGISGMNTLIGAQTTTTNRYIGSIYGAVTNTSTVDAHVADARFNLGQNSTSAPGINTAQLTQRAIQYVASGTDVGTMTTAALASTAAKALHNWPARATRAAPNRAPVSIVAYREAICVGTAAISPFSYTLSWDMTGAPTDVATSIPSMADGASYSLAPRTGQTNPAFYGSAGILARNKALSFTDSTTVGAAMSTAHVFDANTLMHVSFRMASLPAGTRLIASGVNTTGDKTTWTVEVNTSGHIIVTIYPTTASGSTTAVATIAADHCTGGWFHLFFYTYLDTVIKVKAATSLGTASGAMSSGVAVAQSTSRIVLGGMITSGPTLSASAACEIGYIGKCAAIASALGTSVDPSAYERNWRLHLSGS